MASMNEKDYYAILEVSETATTEEIRKAFQVKARKLHPDVNKAPDAEARFKEVSEAYAVLSDEGKRRRYDAMRSGNPFAGGYGPSGSPAGSNSYGQDPFGWGFPFGGVDFSSWRSQGSRRSRAYKPQTGADIEYDLTLTPTQAQEGVRKGITYQRFSVCEACHGSGSVHHSEASSTCPTCGGTGHIHVDLSGIFGFGTVEMVCPECEGTGHVVADPCEACGGSGRVLSASEVVVNVPPHAHDGDEIRMEGKGNAGTNGSKTGDFVVRVRVPEEQVTLRQSMGARAIGIALPFFAVDLATGASLLGTIIVAMLVVFGVRNIVGDGIKRSQRWWRNLGYAVVNGALTGIAWALVAYMFFSCTAGLGRW